MPPVAASVAPVEAVSLGRALPPPGRAGSKVYAAASSVIVPMIRRTTHSKSKPRFFSWASSDTDFRVAT
jgi:hypothetical protein